VRLRLGLSRPSVGVDPPKFEGALAGAQAPAEVNLDLLATRAMLNISAAAVAIIGAVFVAGSRPSAQ
jgi:hypothetical protein